MRPVGRGALYFISIIADGLSKSLGLIGNLIAKLTFGSGRCIKLMIKPFKFFVFGYFGMFSSLYFLFKKLGILGELIFTFVGLLMLLWPMIVPYIAENKILYFPAIILTTYLCIQGKNAITAK